MNLKKITIAIDGYSSCGKSTLAKALAKKLNYIFIDSGAMYRGVALYCIQNNLSVNGEINKPELIKQLKNISLSFYKNEETDKADLLLNNTNVEHLIRQIEVANIVSKVASIKEVREKLVLEQQEMGKNGGIIMDGRDIGSVVFPNAELKIFVTAKPEIRVERRYLELINKGEKVSKDEIKNNLEERDYLDTTRSESPLIQSNDAFLLDNSDLNQEEQLNLIYALALSKL
jgi:CMP/dCMP kinase